MEIWKDVVGYEGLYRVSNEGNIFSIKRNRLLKPQPNWKGYLMVILSKNGAKGLMIHRLVCFAFIPNPLNLPQVNHIDGIKSNNVVTNLEWCSASDNCKHAFALGLSNVQGEKGRTAKLNNIKVLEIREFFQCNPSAQLKPLALKYGVTVQQIAHIKYRRSWKHI